MNKIFVKKMVLQNHVQEPDMSEVKVRPAAESMLSVCVQTDMNGKMEVVSSGMVKTEIYIIVMGRLLE